MGSYLVAPRSSNADHNPATTTPTNTTPPDRSIAQSSTSPHTNTNLSFAPSPITAQSPTTTPTHTSPTPLASAPTVSVPPTAPPIPTDRVANTALSTVTLGPSPIVPSTEPKHSVFISHAGEDKVTIAFPLRDKLKQLGISAFVDEADMSPGTHAPKAMGDAMETSSVAVIVLSPEFVSLVIPFFYRLKISELYDEPRLDRRDEYGNLLYSSDQSKFYERQKSGEPEADVEKIKATLETLRQIMGVRNDYEATNHPSLLMKKRRETLLEELCHRVRDTVPSSAVNLPSEDKHIKDEQNQADVDRFRRFFAPLFSDMRAVLDLDSRDKDVNPTTAEGWAKHDRLDETGISPRDVSILGIGGVGKSIILQTLSADDHIRKRFPDGLHVIKLGKDTSSGTLLRQICHLLKKSGAEKSDATSRRRRGRRARPSQLTPAMHRAVSRFSRIVGGPNVVEPAGFRDFRGWLARLGARESRPIWDELIATIARDVACDRDAVNALKEDVVREIVKCVVVPRQDESAKLVSVNAGRQASRPRYGTTLMLVLEQQLERVMYRLPQLVNEIPPPSPGSDDGMDGLQDSKFPLRQSSSLGQSVDKLPSVSDILGARHGSSSCQTLPSFRELDDSLRRNGSGSG